MRHIRAAIALAAVATAVLAVTVGQSGAAGTGTAATCKKPTGKPIVVGSTLSLTGFLSTSSAVHKVMGQVFLNQINKCGLLGRPVKWDLLDDQSSAANIPQLYEQLISQDHVDLLLGAFGTANISAAVQVAQRHNMVITYDTSSALYNYDCQFSAAATGVAPGVFFPRQLMNALKSVGKNPQTIAFVSSSFPSAQIVTDGDSSYPGAIDTLKRMGLRVVADLRYPFGSTDFSSIASRLQAADPDLIWHSATGVDPANLLTAMASIHYRPKGFWTFAPSPGPLLGLGATAENAFTVSPFIPASKIGRTAAGKEISKAFTVAAKAAGLPYTQIDPQAAVAYAQWEVLAAGVVRAKSLDQAKICKALQKPAVPTLTEGKLLFGSAGPSGSNLYTSRMVLAQIQKGQLVQVYPRKTSLPKVKPLYPNG
jgi:branched-chain amino acid transport system substrate-binding protein